MRLFLRKGLGRTAAAKGVGGRRKYPRSSVTCSFVTQTGQLRLCKLNCISGNFLSTSVLACSFPRLRYLNWWSAAQTAPGHYETPKERDCLEGRSDHNPQMHHHQEVCRHSSRNKLKSNPTWQDRGVSHLKATWWTNDCARRLPGTESWQASTCKRCIFS